MPKQKCGLQGPGMGSTKQRMEGYVPSYGTTVQTPVWLSFLQFSYSSECMREQSNERIEETFIYKPLAIIITLVEVTIYSEIQCYKTKAFKGLYLLLIRTGIYIPMTEVLKAGKKVELNGLIRRKNNEEKCNLEFHLNIGLFVSLLCNLQPFDILLIPYKILKLIVRELF